MFTEKMESSVKRTFDDSAELQGNNEPSESMNDQMLTKTPRGYRLVDTFVVMVIIVISVMLFFPATLPLISYLLKLLGIDVSW